jgi:hypothetical protein
MAATAAISGVISTPDTTLKQLFIDFAVTLTGDYGGSATNGDTLDLTALGDALKSTQLPNWVEFDEHPPAGTAPTGYRFGYAPGTTQKNGLLTIMGGAGTPAGTVASTSTAPTITTSSGGVATALGVAAGALSEVAGAAGITGVQAPAITSTFTGTAPASGGSQYPEGSAYSAALLAAVIRGRAWFPSEI